MKGKDRFLIWCCQGSARGRSGNWPSYLDADEII